MELSDTLIHAGQVPGLIRESANFAFPQIGIDFPTPHFDNPILLGKYHRRSAQAPVVMPIELLS